MKIGICLDNLENLNFLSPHYCVLTHKYPYRLSSYSCSMITTRCLSSPIITRLEKNLMIKEFVDISSLLQLKSFARQLAKQTKGLNWVFLNGDLGTGKTTFSQHFIASKGYKGRVTSPTYAIIQDYSIPNGYVIHCDLYRLSEPEELDELGLIEIAEEKKAIVLVEWANKGLGILPNPDIQLNFLLEKEKRSIDIIFS